MDATTATAPTTDEARVLVALLELRKAQRDRVCPRRTFTVYEVRDAARMRGITKTEGLLLDVMGRGLVDCGNGRLWRLTPSGVLAALRASR